MQTKDIQKYACEFLGTFALVFFAAGSIIMDKKLGGLGPLGAGIISGAVVTIVIYAFVDISGAHVNPAFTIALSFIGRFEKRLIPGYVFSQILGSALAGLFLFVLIGNEANMGANMPNSDLGVTSLQAVIIETFLSFFLMWVICGVAYKNDKLAPFGGLVIGTTVGISVMLIGPYAGASMNPARAFGPYLMKGSFEQYWIYVVGPVVGMTLAGKFYQFTHK